MANVVIDQICKLVEKQKVSNSDSVSSYESSFVDEHEIV